MNIYFWNIYGIFIMIDILQRVNICFNIFFANEFPTFVKYSLNWLDIILVSDES